jgi:hypothetical protein
MFDVFILLCTYNKSCSHNMYMEPEPAGMDALLDRMNLLTADDASSLMNSQPQASKNMRVKTELDVVLPRILTGTSNLESKCRSNLILVPSVCYYLSSNVSGMSTIFDKNRCRSFKTVRLLQRVGQRIRACAAQYQ